MFFVSSQHLEFMSSAGTGMALSFDTAVCGDEY